MEMTHADHPRAWRLITELTLIFLFGLMLAGIRAALPEPPNPYRLHTVEPADPNSDVNRHYDRPNDEVDSYVPAIRRIYAHWPSLDLAATEWTHKPPGYPLLMATAAKVVGLDLARLRIVQMFLGASIPVVLYGWLRQRRRVAQACAIIAPLVLSSFLIKDSTYLTTDSPALLCVAGAMIALLRGPWSTWSFGALAVFSSVAVCIRQDTLWLVGPTVLLWGIFYWRPLASWRPARARPTPAQGFGLVAAIVVPVGVVAGLALAWNGLVPRGFYRGMAQAGFSLAPLAYLLSVVAIFWWPYLIASHGLRTVLRLARDRSTLAWGLGGLAIAVAGNTAYNHQNGHWGGYLWSAAAFLPAIAGRSLPFLILAPLGSAALGFGWRTLRDENRTAAAILSAGFVAWALSCTLNPYVFHRYYEPYVLLFLVALAALSNPAKVREFSVRGYAWLLLLGAGQLAITVATLFLSLFPELRR